jgi:hypothetical protein
MRYLLIPWTLILLGVVLATAADGADAPAKDKKADAKEEAKNLVPNGDFEEGDLTPKGWQTIDGLTTYYVKDEDPKRGKVIKIDTDVDQVEGYDWWTKIRNGASSKDAPKKTPTKGAKYDTLAGLDGVWYWSDYIPIKKGQAYWLTIDAKGPGGGMLAWLVGYPKKGSTAFGSESGAFDEAYKERMEKKKANRGRNFDPFIHDYVWKGQLSSMAGTSPDKWQTFSRRKQPFRPSHNPIKDAPEVKFVRVMIYAYWPPGIYYADNVRLTEVEDNGVGLPKDPEK